MEYYYSCMRYCTEQGIENVVPVSNFMHMNMHGNGSGRNCTDYTDGNGSGRNCTDYTGRHLRRLALTRQS